MKCKRIAALFLSLGITVCGASASDAIHLKSVETDISLSCTNAAWADKDLSILVYSTKDRFGNAVSANNINELNYSELVVYADILTADSEGKGAASWLMDNNDISADYMVDISLTDGTQRKTETFYFASLEDRTRVQGEIDAENAAVKADPNKNITPLLTYFTNNNEANDETDYKVIKSLGYLFDEYLGLADKDKICSNAIVLDMGDFKKAFNEATVVELLNAADANSIIDVFEKYKADIGTDIKADANYKRLSKDGNLDSLKTLLSETEFTSFSDVGTKVSELGAISVLNAETAYGEVYGILYDNNGVFRLSFTDYNNLSEYYKTEVLKAMINKTSGTLKSVGDVQTRFTTAVAQAKENMGSNSGANGSPAGGGSGGGGGSVNNGGIALVRDEISMSKEPETVESVTGFNDLDNVSWAREAIENLYSMGIVSGVSETAFEPERNIKREEFLKIVIEAFKFEISEGETAFSDVISGEWYEKYVKTAVENGIVNGISENVFGVGENITREQMAAIIFRAMKAEAVNEYEEFADDDMISEYAKSAIYTMKNAGIISGMGENIFAPLGYATRAQAAKMIYTAIQ